MRWSAGCRLAAGGALLKTGPVLENQLTAIAELCQRGLHPADLRAAVLPRLRRVMPIDAVWWAMVDPATLLFTQAYREAIPHDTGPYFVENEFLGDDVNKWVELAQLPRGARTLVEATGGQLAASARYRDIFEPLGLEDELRLVLRSRGAVWGFMCLHRERGGRFSRQEVEFAQRLAARLAEGLRLGLLVQSLEMAEGASSLGLILLGPDGSFQSANAAAEHWLDGLDPARDGGLPVEIHAVAAQLRAGAAAPQLRVRTADGRWAILQASRMPNQGEEVVAVIIQEATQDQIAPVVMRAYGLTEQERVLSGLVFQGLSTKQISARLHITEHTVQDHLKSIFEKTGVRSRRDLVATVLRQRYLPQAQAGRRPGPSGYFA